MDETASVSTSASSRDKKWRAWQKEYLPKIKKGSVLHEDKVRNHKLARGRKILLNFYKCFQYCFYPDCTAKAETFHDVSWHLCSAHLPKVSFIF